MPVNTELFKKIYKQITEHPESHDQGLYEANVEWNGATRNDGLPVCGTTRCVAGWAIRFAHPDKDLAQGTEAILGDGSGDYFEAGKEVLGLDYDEANELFSGGLRETKAVRLVARYAGIEGN